MKKVLALILLVVSMAQAETYIIGDTGSSHQAPFFYIPDETTRLSQIYIPHRQLPACNILRIDWLVYRSGITPGTISRLKIILFHSTLSEVQGDFSLNYGQYYNIKEVYNHTNVSFNPTADTWLGYDLDQDYAFNGNCALVIFVTRTASGTVGCTTQTGFENSGPYRILTGTETINVRSRKYHRLRITTGYVGIKPTSLGRIKAL